MTASVSSVARKHGIAKSLLFRWRRDAGLQGKKVRRGADAFLPVVMQQPSAVLCGAQAHAHTGMIEIELANGHKLRITGSIQSDALKQVIAVLNASGA